MDGFGGTVKSNAFQKVKSRKVKMVNAEGFAKYKNEIVEGMSLICQKQK